MSGAQTREITVEAVLEDPYDGLIRLLGDAQRFGIDLLGVSLATAADGVAVATITLAAPASVEPQLLGARLARHPAVRHASARDTSCPSRALAA